MLTVAEMFKIKPNAGAERSSFEKANLQIEENVNGRVDMMSDLQTFRFQNNSSNISSLERAEILFEKGIDAFQSQKYEDGVEFLDSALRIRVQHYGEYAPECGTTYLEYGRALCFNATEYTISQIYDDSESSEDESEDDDELSESEDDDELSISSGSSFADTETSSGTPAAGARIRSSKEALLNGNFREDISNMEEEQAEGSEAPAIDDASSDNEAMEDEDDDLYYASETLKIARTIFKDDEKVNELNIADASRTLGNVYVKKNSRTGANN